VAEAFNDQVLASTIPDWPFQIGRAPGLDDREARATKAPCARQSAQGFA
jgi:hypothetical protein